MTIFITGQTGHTYPLDFFHDIVVRNDVVTMYRYGHDGTVQLEDTFRREIYEEAVARSKERFFAAAPDYYLVTRCMEPEDTYSPIKLAIVGWRYDGYAAYPITLEGGEYSGQGVLHPDGHVECQDGTYYDCLDNFVLAGARY